MLGKFINHVFLIRFLNKYYFFFKCNFLHVCWCLHFHLRSMGKKKPKCVPTHEKICWIFRLLVQPAAQYRSSPFLQMKRHVPVQVISTQSTPRSFCLWLKLPALCRPTRGNLLSRDYRSLWRGFSIFPVFSTQSETAEIFKVSWEDLLVIFGHPLNNLFPLRMISIFLLPCRLQFVTRSRGLEKASRSRSKLNQTLEKSVSPSVSLFLACFKYFVLCSGI